MQPGTSYELVAARLHQSVDGPRRYIHGHVGGIGRAPSLAHAARLAGEQKSRLRQPALGRLDLTAHPFVPLFHEFHDTKPPFKHCAASQMNCSRRVHGASSRRRSRAPSRRAHGVCDSRNKKFGAKSQDVVYCYPYASPLPNCGRSGCRRSGADFTSKNLTARKSRGSHTVDKKGDR
jgi:hypothetical protein